jgi:hypothetical protein
MKICGTRDCNDYAEPEGNKCRLFKDILECGNVFPLKAQTAPVAEVPCSDGLEARVGRVIFLSMKPGHMVMNDWDSGKALGENNSFRKRIEMAARLSIIEIESL